jgi:hypothetical protein
VALLADADRLFQGPGCEIIKDQRKIKIARIRVKLGGRNRALYLKRYNAFSWRIPLGSLFRRSGAVKALHGAAVLSSARIGGAKPVAALESRCWGMVTRSFLHRRRSRKENDRCLLARIFCRSGGDGFRCRHSFLRALACYFGRCTASASIMAISRR